MLAATCKGAFLSCTHRKQAGSHHFTSATPACLTPPPSFCSLVPLTNHALADCDRPISSLTVPLRQLSQSNLHAPVPRPLITLSRAFTSAPFSISTWHTSSEQISAALCKGVHCFCRQGRQARTHAAHPMSATPACLALLPFPKSISSPYDIDSRTYHPSHCLLYLSPPPTRLLLPHLTPAPMPLSTTPSRSLTPSRTLITLSRAFTSAPFSISTWHALYASLELLWAAQCKGVDLYCRQGKWKAGE